MIKIIIKPTELVYNIKHMMLDSTLQEYSIICGCDFDGKTEFYSDDVKKFIESLNDHQRQSLLNLVKLLIENNISQFMAWFSNIFYLENQREDVKLLINNKVINRDGYLFDIWQNIIECSMTEEELKEEYDV